MKKNVIRISVFLLLLIGARLFLFEIYVIRKESMRNSYKPGDRVVILKNLYSIHHHSVLVLRHENKDIIKRCVGLPGDTLKITNGNIYVNNKKQDLPVKAILPLAIYPDDVIVQSAIYYAYRSNWSRSDFGPYVIPFKGMTISLDPEIISKYVRLIEQDDPDFRMDTTSNSTQPLYYRFKHDYFFMAGDNRPESEDSREFGPIADTYIKGKVILKF